MMQTIHKNSGLSSTAIKMIALACMVLDHIHYFFEFTGAVPVFFSMAGRLAAPLFLFCLAEGFAHTHDRRRYFLRIYLIAAAMSALLYMMAFYGLFVREDGFYPLNGMMTTCAILLIIWQGFDWLKARRFVRGGLAIFGPLALPFVAVRLLALVPSSSGIPGFLCTTLLPLWGWLSPDASLPVLLAGIFLYPLRSRRGLQAAVFAAATLLYHVVFVGFMVSRLPGFSLVQMFTTYYEWYGVFAVIPMLCYNGKRGRGYKALFYAFYPAHIYVLYGLSCLVYGWMPPA